MPGDTARSLEKYTSAQQWICAHTGIPHTSHDNVSVIV